MKKILCLCDAGQVRSVAMATILCERGHFAAASNFDAYNEVMKKAVLQKDASCPGDNYYEFYVEDFFDHVLFMQEGGTHFIGRDEWGDIDHSELRAKCIELAQRLGL